MLYLFTDKKNQFEVIKMTTEQQKKFSEICRHFKWKCTPQRLAVYDSVYGNRCHPDVDSVWQLVKLQLPTVTRESVYRILNEFSSHGLIWRLDHVTAARYDSNTDPHGHFICESCGEITDFALKKDVAVFAGEVPGNIRHMEIRFTGICKNCQTAGVDPVQ